MEESAMRVGLLTAGFLLTSAIVSNAAIVNMSPPPSSPPPSAKAQAPAQSPVPVTAKAPVPTPRPVMAKVLVKAKVTCPCDCPKNQTLGRHAHVSPAPRRMAHGARRHYANSGYYNYGAAAPVVRHDWHGQGRAAPNDAAIVQEGVAVDDRGWTGGVSYAPDGVGSGGFVDGYGQAHFANGGSVENGPSYNSYGQSFQFNPSQPGPFQPRLMGGLAPSK
jgi:hypothetical protein